jgi:hypothetical protein
MWPDVQSHPALLEEARVISAYSLAATGPLLLPYATAVSFNSGSLAVEFALHNSGTRDAAGPVVAALLDFSDGLASACVGADGNGALCASGIATLRSVLCENLGVATYNEFGVAQRAAQQLCAGGQGSGASSTAESALGGMVTCSGGTNGIPARATDCSIQPAQRGSLARTMRIVQESERYRALAQARRGRELHASAPIASTGTSGAADATSGTLAANAALSGADDDESARPVHPHGGHLMSEVAAEVDAQEAEWTAAAHQRQLKRQRQLRAGSPRSVPASLPIGKPFWVGAVRGSAFSVLQTQGGTGLAAQHTSGRVRLELPLPDGGCSAAQSSVQRVCARSPPDHVATAVLAVSDDKTCRIYGVPCVDGGEELPLLFVGQASCAPCALLRQRCWGASVANSTAGAISWCSSLDGPAVPASASASVPPSPSPSSSTPPSTTASRSASTAASASPSEAAAAVTATALPSAPAPLPVSVSPSTSAGPSSPAAPSAAPTGSSSSGLNSATASPPLPPTPSPEDAAAAGPTQTPSPGAPSGAGAADWPWLGVQGGEDALTLQALLIGSGVVLGLVVTLAAGWRRAGAVEVEGGGLPAN